MAAAGNDPTTDLLRITVPRRIEEVFDAWVLQDKNAVIYGGGGAIGGAVALAFAGEISAADQARICFTTSPWTSVSRKSRPTSLKVSRVWSIPSRYSIVAWRSWTETTSSTAR